MCSVANVRLLLRASCTRAHTEARGLNHVAPFVQSLPSLNLHAAGSNQSTRTDGVKDSGNRLTIMPRNPERPEAGNPGSEYVAKGLGRHIASFDGAAWRQLFDVTSLPSGQ